jgi:hypothetical protein
MENNKAYDGYKVAMVGLTVGMTEGEVMTKVRANVLAECLALYGDDRKAKTATVNRTDYDEDFWGEVWFRYNEVFGHSPVKVQEKA